MRKLHRESAEEVRCGVCPGPEEADLNHKELYMTDKNQITEAPGPGEVGEFRDKSIIEAPFTGPLAQGRDGKHLSSTRGL